MARYAVSDIHGHKKCLEKALDKVKYNPQVDELYLLGDYIDRGPEAAETVMLVKELVKNGAKAIRGNHESMLGMYLNDSNQQLFLQNGGFKTIDSYMETYGDRYIEALKHDSKFLNRLPCYTSTNDGMFVFVHAGFIARKDNQRESDMLWLRYLDKENTIGWWTQNFSYLEATIVFGHTGVTYLGCSPGTPYQSRNLLGIDAEVYRTRGYLMLIDLDTKNTTLVSKSEVYK